MHCICQEISIWLLGQVKNCTEREVSYDADMGNTQTTATVSVRVCYTTTDQ